MPPPRLYWYQLAAREQARHPAPPLSGPALRERQDPLYTSERDWQESWRAWSCDSWLSAPSGLRCEGLDAEGASAHQRAQLLLQFRTEAGGAVGKANRYRAYLAGLHIEAEELINRVMLHQVLHPA